MEDKRGWLAAALLLLAGAAFGGEFQYQIPAGWRELPTATRPGDADTSQVPPHMVREAKDPNFVVVAIDPDSTTPYNEGATLYVVEARTTLGHVTYDVADKAASSVMASLRKQGTDAQLLHDGVVQVDGVTGVSMMIQLETPAGPRLMAQYIIPGRKSSAVLTYSAPKADWPKNAKAITASLQATRGGYDPGPASGGGGGGGGSGGTPVRSKWQFFMPWLGGAVMVVFFFLLKEWAERRGQRLEADAPPRTAAAMPAKKAPPRRATKNIWFCGDCGKPVPIRLDTCRCGGKKPA